MALVTARSPVRILKKEAHPLSGATEDYDHLLELVGHAQFVLLGEASHGTHEFYKARAEITKRLIAEKAFTVLAWEADWPDTFRVNRYVRGTSRDQTALESLGGFKRFPAWMWRNADILDLIGWLREYNEQLSVRAPKVGVYGLDLYSLYSSMHAVIEYLQKVDPKSAREAQRRYACFEDFAENPQSYGATASLHASLTCEKEVLAQLLELRHRRAELIARNGRGAADEFFSAEQNARLARNAEQYYRAMYRGRPDTWNLRDTHMVETLESVMAHLQQRAEHPKAIVWAHNSHLGDARATQMSERDELNIGQLVRERHGQDAVLVGFTTHTGTVTAASDWGEPAERKRVRPSITGSYESLFHQTDLPKFLVALRHNAELSETLRSPRLERAIGVIYHPETERWSHYFDARLSEQFDAVIHFDHTRAVEPLEPTPIWEEGEAPETYPSGI